ncbi:hypothetical protein Goklo_021379, partial [Gossypium klotzschianum]|nr:hypothetical protein [Gossypium klotzschianum]
MKIDSCFPEFDKKDLLHAIGATFGGVWAQCSYTGGKRVSPKNTGRFERENNE